MCVCVRAVTARRVIELLPPKANSSDSLAGTRATRHRMLAIHIWPDPKLANYVHIDQLEEADRVGGGMNEGSSLAVLEHRR